MTHFAPIMLKPTATILVDDDPFFIDTVKSLLPCDTFPSVFDAENLEPLQNAELFLSSGKEVSNANLNSKSFLSLLFNSDDIPVSTIVIDQCMTPKNGLEIFRSMKSNFTQKILISNFFKHNDAVQALNEGIINTYLCKMHPNFIKNLSESIRESQYRFFCKISLATTNFLANDNPLIEKETLSLFKKIQDKYSIKYYESSSNLRLFSFSNQASSDSLKVRMMLEEEIDTFLQSQQSETAPDEAVQLIKKRKMLPCFKGNIVPEGQEWVQYLRPAQSLDGNNKYFYSVYWDNKNESF